MILHHIKYDTQFYIMDDCQIHRIAICHGEPKNMFKVDWLSKNEEFEPEQLAKVFRALALFIYPPWYVRIWNFLQNKPPTHL